MRLIYAIGLLMPYTNTWVHEPYILRTTLTGLIIVDEVDGIMHDYLDILNQQDAVYFILDFGRAATIPTTLLQVDSIIDVIHHTNTQWFAIVNPTGFDSNTTRLLVQDKVKIFDDKDKALGFLRGMVRLDTGTALDSD